MLAVSALQDQALLSRAVAKVHVVQMLRNVFSPCKPGLHQQSGVWRWLALRAERNTSHAVYATYQWHMVRAVGTLTLLVRPAAWV